MSQLKSLKASRTLKDLAKLLECKTSGLSYLLYVKSEEKRYRTFDVPKKGGGVRQISAPSDDLMLVQRKLSNLLQNCIAELREAYGYSEDGPKRDRISHGFNRKRSIATNALEHRNRRFVFNIDLSDFFGSINFGRVRGFFISDKNFQLDPKVATIVAQIACHDNRLPQGSPCSPVISNLIGHILDVHLVRLAKRVGCTYSRYADDLTFSTNMREFAKEIAYPSGKDPHQWLPGGKLVRAITHSGFTINPRKTRMQYHDSRQEVTGLVVNRKVNVRAEYRHSVRAMVKNLLVSGEFTLERSVEESGAFSIKRVPGELGQLRGMLGFIDWIDRSNKIRLGESRRDLSGKEKMFRRFLLYKEFYAASAPVLICEGKTDSVYITHAIRSLAADYPDLASIDGTGKISIKLRRFRYTDSSTGRILGIGGGSGDLKQLLVAYHEEAAKFSAPGMSAPVIVLVDNDTGAGPVFSTARQITRRTVDKNAPFTHLTKNLYLLATPLPAGASESAIEDLFDSAIRSTKLGGRTFSPSNTTDSSIHYGKADFAYRVVKPHADSINFSGFKPLLDKFVAVIEHHRKHMIPLTMVVPASAAP